MATLTGSGGSILGMFRGLTGDTRTLIRQEVQLAKTELLEKISRLSRNAVILAAGGLVAYAGLIVFLTGMGWLLAWALAVWGLQPIFAAFLGLAVVGLLVALTGGLMLWKAVRTMSKESLKPQRTLQSLQELKNGHSPGQSAGSAPPPPPSLQTGGKPSSQQVHAQVEETENRMGVRLDEIGRRLNPKEINARIKTRLQAQPYSAGLIALGAGFMGGLLLTRRDRREER